MKISIVIPLYNAEKHLEKLLPQLRSLVVSGVCDVIFIDSSSIDGTHKIIVENGFDNIHVIKSSDFDHGGTRAKAKKYTDADIIVFLTQDALLMNGYSIESLIKVFENDKIGAAYGRQLPHKNANFFSTFLRQFNYPNKSYVRKYEERSKFGIKTAFLSNSFSAYRRSAMDDIGWFKDGLILGEDTYAGAKLLKSGYELAYVAEACVYHSHNYSIWEEFSRYFDIGVFHQMETWILDDFGKPEGEGFKYIKKEFKYIVNNKAFLRIPEFVIRNGVKYLGYKLGLNYKKLPAKVILRLSMHKRWWAKYD